MQSLSLQDPQWSWTDLQDPQLSWPHLVLLITKSQRISMPSGDCPAGTCPESPETLSTGPPVKPGLDRLSPGRRRRSHRLGAQGCPAVVKSSPVSRVGPAAHARLYRRAGTRAPCLPRRLRSGSEWAPRSRLAQVSAVPSARSRGPATAFLLPAPWASAPTPLCELSGSRP